MSTLNNDRGKANLNSATLILIHANMFVRLNISLRMPFVAPGFYK